MPSLKSIRKRISTVKSTQKITRAMKMVAGARLNRAQQRITALRPYAVKTGEITRSVVATITHALEAGEQEEGSLQDELTHPLLTVRPERTVLYLLITSDRGLCGGFNANVSKIAEASWKQKVAEGRTVLFATVGKKGRDYVARRGATIDQHFVRGNENVGIEFAGTIARYVTQKYARGEIDAVYVVYGEFKSAMTQIPRAELLVPFAPQSPEEAAGAASAGEFLFEPDRDRLLERLIPMYVQVTLYRALLESMASELGARMSAMDAATNNAKDMISKLTLVYNRARQAAITKELMEIIGGAEALKE